MNLELLNRTGLITVSAKKNFEYLETMNRKFKYQQYSDSDIVKIEYTDETDEMTVYLHEDIDLIGFSDDIYYANNISSHIDEDNHAVIFPNLLQFFYRQDAMTEFNTRLKSKIAGANLLSANIDFSSVRLIIFNKTSLAKSKRYMRKLGYKNAEIEYDGSVWTGDFKQ